MSTFLSLPACKSLRIGSGDRLLGTEVDSLYAAPSGKTLTVYTGTGFRPPSGKILYGNQYLFSLERSDGLRLHVARSRQRGP